MMNAPHAVDSKLADFPRFENYRVVSKAAVLCVVFAFLSLLAYVSSVFVLLPFLGLFCGIYAMLQCRAYPDELTGATAAQIGIAINAVVLATAVGMHAYIFATEVPDGYERISFYALQPNERTKVPVSEKALEIDGKKVFLKGYVRPGLKKNRLKKFVLVGDFGSCCFGGNPKITDVVAVTLTNEKDYVNYGYRLRRIGGEFVLHKRPKKVQAKDLPYILYEIEADYVK